jgi:ribosomal protein S12 methylthiotransferase accessory factor
MRRSIAVIGEGLLADYVSGHVSERYEVLRQSDWSEGIPEAVELILVLYDEEFAIDESLAESLQHSGIPWLRGVIALDEVIVGPLVRPGTPGCSHCADNRRYAAKQKLTEPWQLLQGAPTAAGTSDKQAAAVVRLGLRQAACLLEEEAQSIQQGGRALTEEHLYFVNLQTLKTTRHYFLADPLCPVCSRIPDDSESSARFSLQPRPKINPGRYRSRSLDELRDVLLKDYLDTRSGLFNANLHDLVSPFAGVCVNLPSFLAGDVVTAGRSHSYAESELTAVLEGLERYCGMIPRGKRSVVRDSYNRLAAQALDPRTTGLYSKEQYELPDFPFEPFDPDRPIDWVWGYSFLQECPLLVPESLAYYSSGFGESFVQEGSNGCALGGSLEEALFHGLLEVVERDSFLIAWYARLPLPRLDIRSAHDPELQLMAERLRAVAGYEVHLYNMTMENGIPAIWVLAKSENPGKMNLLCSAGAHLDPVRAAKSAIHEIAGMAVILQDQFAAEREELVSMFRDSALVQQMENHVMLYGLPEAEERLHFLLDSGRTMRTFDEEFKRQESHADLTEELKALLQTFHRLNLEVITVDQSSPETLRNGLYCVKVLVPGMLPMTFGHHLRRLEGLERVLRVPMELGYANERLTLERLNPHPHPFL